MLDKSQMLETEQMNKDNGEPWPQRFPGTKKSKRVSWASDVNLCQVRLFLSEDSPSQVGQGAQDHLQAKASWLLHSAGAGDEHLPPGFEGGAHSANQLKQELSQIPVVKWKCPPRVLMNPHWQVVAGQESKEADTENQREMRVLEAVYPRPSAIPPSPSLPLESENQPYDDCQTPLIPVTPIEDEDAPDSSLNSVVTPTNNPLLPQLPVPSQSMLTPGIMQTSQCNVSMSPNAPTNDKHGVGLVPGVEPDVVAAASAAFTAIMRSNEQGSLIDHELLIKILSNPKLIEKLVTDYGTTPTNANANQQTTSSSAWSSSMNLSALQSGPLPVHMNRVAPESSVATQSTNGHFYPMTNAVTTMLHSRPPPPPPLPSGIVQMSTTSAVKAPPPVKDINYYKSLIQQHGGERPEIEDPIPPPPPPPPQFNNHQQHMGVSQESVQSSKQREPKSKKPCIYFNSSRGCKHGANCVFQHDSSFQQRMGSIPEAQSAKRMKLDREITGRT